MKEKLIKKYINDWVKKEYNLNLSFGEISDFKYSSIELIDSNPNEIIVSEKPYIITFKDLFNGVYGSNPTLFVSYFCDYGEGYSPFVKVFESMNINTLEIKKIDFEIY